MHNHISASFVLANNAEHIQKYAYYPSVNYSRNAKWLNIRPSVNITTILIWLGEKKNHMINTINVKMRSKLSTYFV